MFYFLSSGPAYETVIRRKLTGLASSGQCLDGDPLGNPLYAALNSITQKGQNINIIKHFFKKRIDELVGS